ncbi:MAG: glyceraldehyde 3-phosphate dehydrogenase NAD-binding domain-containing protein [Puia sp.]|nr:glyceraldehyde 3-phosphate dehydrogenase NAD-binding domain-containing protein [Puia sp.]
MRIAINGMGRIGRLLCRRLIGLEGIELVAVNDLMDRDNLAYLLRHDSIYGTLETPLVYRNGTMTVGARNPAPAAGNETAPGMKGTKGTLAVFQQEDPLQLPWKELGVDVVLECTGKFSSKEGAGLHLRAGAKKVLLSTTGSEDIPLLIYGFNQHLLTPETDIISPGGCMTNCATHILYILQSIGIDSAHLNILHSYTSRQELVDAPHKQFRRGRAAAESIIPVEIDLPQSLERLFPLLKDRIAAVSTRVPVANGALADFTVLLKSPASAEAINSLFRTSSLNDYRGILACSDDPLVSLDIKGDTHSCIIDTALTSSIGDHVKIMVWFDNEFGYTSRILDWLYYWKKLLALP